MNSNEAIKSYVERVERLEQQVALLVKLLTSPTAEEQYAAWTKTPRSTPDEQCGNFDPAPGRIYFAHFHKSGRLKIGFTTKIGARMRALESAAGESFKLLASIPGNRALELRSHMAFAGWRLKGEWFLYTPECAAHLGDYLAKLSDLEGRAA